MTTDRLQGPTQSGAHFQDYLDALKARPRVRGVGLNRLGDYELAMGETGNAITQADEDQRSGDLSLRGMLPTGKELLGNLDVANKLINPAGIMARSGIEAANLPEGVRRVAGAAAETGLSPLTYAFGGAQVAPIIGGAAASAGAKSLTDKVNNPALRFLAEQGVFIAGTGVASGAQSIAKAAVTKPRSLPGQLLRAPATGGMSAIGPQGGKLNPGRGANLVSPEQAASPERYEQKLRTLLGEDYDSYIRAKKIFSGTESGSPLSVRAEEEMRRVRNGPVGEKLASLEGLSRTPPRVSGGQNWPLRAGSGELDRIFGDAAALTIHDRPGAIDRFLQRVPVLSKVREGARPALKMTGDKEFILTAANAENMAQADVASRLYASRVPVIQQIERVFGADGLHGGKTNVPFVGTAEQAASAETGKLTDIALNPDLYRLSPERQAVIDALQAHNDAGLEHVVSGFGADIGRFDVKPGGAFLRTVDASEEALNVFGNETRAASTGGTKARFYGSARERMAADPSFVPVNDVQVLIEGADRIKAQAASGNTFRQAIGGKTKLEVMQETHPVLYDRMTTLKNELSRLRSLASGLDEQAQQGIDQFMKSPHDTADLTALRDALESTVQRGASADLGAADLRGAMETVREEIKSLRPAWEAANLKPYTYVQDGIYRYFKGDEANLIKEMRQENTGWAKSSVDFVKGIRQTAFSGDLSPFSIQGMQGFFFDPVGGVRRGAGALGRGGAERDPLWGLRESALAKDVAADPTWVDYFAMMGHAPGRDATNAADLSAGWLTKVKGVGKVYGKANDAMMISVTRASKGMWDDTRSQMVSQGIPDIEARLAATDAVSRVYPMLNTTRLGLSRGRASLLKALPTSLSFIHQPTALMAEATRGFAKLATKQTLTPSEKLSIRFMTTLAGSLATAAATSAMLSAQATGGDVQKAGLDAINPDPRNGRFLSVIVGDERVPIGGPYRALMRAIYPKDVEGSPVPLPFAGVWDFAMNRVNPSFRAVADLVRSQDYYGRPIVKGETPERVARGAAYLASSAAPLSAGTVAQEALAGAPASTIPSQVGGQFLGVNIVPESMTAALDRLVYDKHLPDGKGGIATSWGDLSPKGRAQLEQSQEVRDIRHQYRPGAAENVWREVTQGAVDEQNKMDKELSGPAWVAKHGELQAGIAAQRELLRKISPAADFPEATTPQGKALNAYYQVGYSADGGTPLFVDQTTGTVDLGAMAEAQGLYLDSLDPAMRQYVEAQLHPNATAKEQRYYDFKDQLDADWYTIYRDAPGYNADPLLRGYYDEYLKEKRAGFTAANDWLNVNMGPEGKRAIRAIDSFVSDIRARARKNDPGLDAQYVYWYGGTAKTDAAYERLKRLRADDADKQKEMP